jgi:hypothetical protein
MSVRVAVRVAAWLLLIAIAAVTLSPIGLRPTTSTGPSVERFAAFALLGSLFVFGYPKSVLRIVALLISVTGGLELLQHIVPGRHGMVLDFVVKAFGIASGAVAAASVLKAAALRRTIPVPGTNPGLRSATEGGSGSPTRGGAFGASSRDVGGDSLRRDKETS